MCVCVPLSTRETCPLLTTSRNYSMFCAMLFWVQSQWNHHNSSIIWRRNIQNTQRRIWISSNGMNGAATIEVSYDTVFEIDKQKRFHTIEETLLKPCMMKAVNLFLEKSVQRRCRKYACQIILYRGAFLKCLWMWRNRFWLKSRLPFVLLSARRVNRCKFMFLIACLPERH